MSYSLPVHQISISHFLCLICKKLCLKKTLTSTIFLFFLSLFITIIIGNYKGDAEEEKVRNILYKLKGDSIPSSATEYTNAKGVPYVHYIAENGVAATTQYNATIVANYALQYANNFIVKKDSADYQKFFNCIQFLQDSVTKFRNVYLYHFNWLQGWYPNIKPPFTSAMSNGRTIEVCLKAFGFTNDSSYLHFANKLLQAFFIEVKDSGFTYQLNANAYWFEEMAKPNTTTPHILDGHIFALQGIQQYWLKTKNDSAKILLDKGLEGLKNQLHNYDAGKGKLFYDIAKKEADKKYQKIITTQMLQLWQTTNDSTFLVYANKWLKPLQKPYVLRVLQEKNLSGIIFLCFILLTVLSFLNLLKRGVKKIILNL